MVLTMPKPFTVPAGGRDVYRVVRHAAGTARGQVCRRVRVQARRDHGRCITPCSSSMTTARPASSKPPPPTASPATAASAGSGFRPSGGLGGWAPGATPYFLPDGVGRPVHKGADVVFQVHYHPDGKEHTDQQARDLLREEADRESDASAGRWRTTRSTFPPAMRTTSARRTITAAVRRDAARRHAAHAPGRQADEGTADQARRHGGSADLGEGLGFPLAGPVPLRRAGEAAAAGRS